MLRELNLPTFVNMFKTAVRFYPASTEKCKQPQAFAVVGQWSELNASNLGKSICDRGKPYFYSRLWENKKFNPSKLEYEMPVVVLYEMGHQAEGVFEKNQKWRYSFKVIVLDSYDDGARKEGKCTGCQSRLKDEIFQDTETILKNVLRYVSQFKYGSKSGGEMAWFPKPMTLVDFVEDTKATANFQRMLRNTNASVPALRHESTTIENAYGTEVTIRVELDWCDPVEFSNEDEAQIITFDEGCC